MEQRAPQPQPMCGSLPPNPFIANKSPPGEVAICIKDHLWWLAIERHHQISREGAHQWKDSHRRATKGKGDNVAERLGEVALFAHVRLAFAWGRAGGDLADIPGHCHCSVVDENELGFFVVVGRQWRLSRSYSGASILVVMYTKMMSHSGRDRRILRTMPSIFARA